MLPARGPRGLGWKQPGLENPPRERVVLEQELGSRAWGLGESGGRVVVGVWRCVGGGERGGCVGALSAGGCCRGESRSWQRRSEGFGAGLRGGRCSPLSLVNCQGVDEGPEGLRLISDIIREKLGIEMSVLMGANLASEVAEEKFCETTIGKDPPSSSVARTTSRCLGWRHREPRERADLLRRV